jgi:hypothetical protein
MPQYPQVMTQKRAALLWHINVAPPPETDPPVNIDVPYLSVTSGTGEVGDTVLCTHGNWQNMGDLVDTYAWQWQRNGVNVGAPQTNGDRTIQAGDSGTTLTCIVSATNTIGTTAAPPSNGIVIP